MLVGKRVKKRGGVPNRAVDFEQGTRKGGGFDRYFLYDCLLFSIFVLLCILSYDKKYFSKLLLWKSFVISAYFTESH